MRHKILVAISCIAFSIIFIPPVNALSAQVSESLHLGLKPTCHTGKVSYCEGSEGEDSRQKTRRVLGEGNVGSKSKARFHLHGCQ